MLVGTCSDSKADVTEEWQRKLLQLCALFERVESNIILAVSLQKKVGNAPRLLAALINHHLEPHKVPVAKVLVEKASTSNRWKVGSQKPDPFEKYELYVKYSTFVNETFFLHFNQQVQNEIILLVFSSD
jgi:hypothetical protein